MMRSRLFFYALLAAAAAWSTGCSGGGKASLPATTAQTGALSSAQGAMPRLPFVYFAHPRARYGGNLNFSNCEAAPATLLCAAPSTIRRAYDFPDSLKGTGETIVIVDAYGSPTIQSDLKTFDATFGLPDPPALTIYYPGIHPKFQPSNPTAVNWAVETTLDVEWAHAAAPGANIALVVAANDSDEPIQGAEAYAVDHKLGSVLSLSFGAPEATIRTPSRNPDLQEGIAIFARARANGITVIASAGDKGAGNGQATPTAQFPASDPDVLSVGGTNLLLSPSGAYAGENVWNDANNCLAPCILGPDGATGGAPSIIFAAPPYQAPVTGSPMRTIADVAYNASPNTGVEIYVGFASQVAQFGPNGIYAVGGTSQGAPQWAGIIAIINQQQNHVPIGFFNDKLYTIGPNNPSLPLPPLHDITAGNNFFPNGASPGFGAAPGYDFPTGWGTPSVRNLVTVVTGHAPPCTTDCPTPPPTPSPEPTPTPTSVPIP